MKKIEENLQNFKKGIKAKEITHKEVSSKLITMKEDFQWILDQEKNHNIDQSFNQTKLHISALFFF